MKGNPKIKQCSAEHDNLILDLVRRRAAGQSANAIARAMGKPSGPIIKATNAVLADDIVASCDPRRPASEREADVRAAYW